MTHCAAKSGGYNPPLMPTEVITETDALTALEAEWLDLCHRTPDATPFQTPMWLLPWWRAFGSDDLTVIAARDETGLRSLAPLYVVRDEDESLGLFIGTGISDYLDILGDTSLVMPELAGIDCQLWDLQQLRPSSAAMQAPLPDGWSENIENQEPCPTLSINGAGPELENLISTHFRKKIRYYRRALERMGDVIVETPAPDTLDDLLTAFFYLHTARWKRRNLPGVLADETAQRFHREVAPRMLAHGMLRMYATRVAGRIVAVFYGFALHGTVYYYLSGYDPDLEKLSIGTLIVAHAIEEAVRDGATTFDFLRGAEEYKYAWGATDRMNRRRQLIRG
jgi:CelD/BcsL family acetyltransferase involved in cellulose biosynthesis